MGFRAFFSYSRTDDRPARWLHRELDGFRTPKALQGQPGEFGAIPQKLHPIFRDRTDLSGGGELSQRIQAALKESETLIVLCSPAAAASGWVDKEVRTFLELGRGGRIYPVIAPDLPDTADVEGDYFPPSLRGRGLLAADLREVRLRTGKTVGDTRSGGKLKLIAGVLGAPLDSLIQRERRRQRLIATATTAAAALFALVAAVAVYASIEADINRRQALENQRAAENELLKNSMLYSESLLTEGHVLQAWKTFDAAQELGRRLASRKDELSLLRWAFDEQTARPVLVRKLDAEGYISLSAGGDGWIGYASRQGKIAGAVNIRDAKLAAMSLPVGEHPPSTIHRVDGGWLLVSKEEETVRFVDDKGAARDIPLPDRFTGPVAGPALRNKGAVAVIGITGQYDMSLVVPEDTEKRGADVLTLNLATGASQFIARNLAIPRATMEILPDSSWGTGAPVVTGSFAGWDLLRRYSAEAVRGTFLTVSPGAAEIAMVDENTEPRIRLFVPGPNEDKPTFLSGFKTPIRVVAYSDRGDLLASGGEGGEVIVWDVAARKQVAVWQFGQRPITDLAFVENDTLLAAVDDGGTLAVYVRPEPPQFQVQQLPTRQAQVLFKAGTNADVFAASGIRNGPVPVWTSRSSAPTQIFGETLVAAPLVALSSSGRFIMVGDANQGYQVHDIATRDVIATLGAGRNIISAAVNDKEILYGDSQGELIRRSLPSGEDKVAANAGAPAGFVFLDHDSWGWHADKRLVICRSETTCETRSEIGYATTPRDAGFRGQAIFIVGQDGVLSFSSSLDKPLTAIDASGARVVAAGWFGETTLVAVTAQGDILFVNTADGAVFRRVRTGGSAVGALVSKDGTMVRLLSGSAQLTTYDFGKRTPKAEVRAAPAAASKRTPPQFKDPVTALFPGADGGLIAASGDAAFVLDAEGNLIQEVREGLGPLRAALPGGSGMRLIWRDGQSVIGAASGPGEKFAPSLVWAKALGNGAALAIDERGSVSRIDAAGQTSAAGNIGDATKTRFFASNASGSRIAYLTEAGDLAEFVFGSGRDPRQTPPEGAVALFECPDRSCFVITAKEGGLYVWNWGDLRPACRLDREVRNVETAYPAAGQNVLLLATRLGELVAVETKQCEARTIARPSRARIAAMAASNGQLIVADEAGLLSRQTLTSSKEH